MPKLFSTTSKKFLRQIDRPEKDLNRFICSNWTALFPKFSFVASEFPIKGNVRSIGSNGRIDILGYDPESKKFIVFELKRDFDKNITDQAADYRDYIQENFSDVYLNAIQRYNADLPKFTEINQSAVKIILMAKRFSTTQIERAKKMKDNSVTLIKYFWFEDDLVFVDFVNNDPDDLKIEEANTRRINEIKHIIAQDPEAIDIDRFFGVLTRGKDAFLEFLQTLRCSSEAIIDVKQTKIAVRTSKSSFSIVRCGGKGARKAILQINTDIDVSSLHSDLLIDDRHRGDGMKKKGSLGLERYEVFIRYGEDIGVFCRLIEGRY